MIPDPASINILNQEHFQLDYSFYLNIIFLAITGILVWAGFVKGRNVMHHKEMAPKSPGLEKSLKWIAIVCYFWLAAGLVIYFVGI